MTDGHDEFWIVLNSTDSSVQQAYGIGDASRFTTMVIPPLQLPGTWHFAVMDFSCSNPQSNNSVFVLSPDLVGSTLVGSKQYPLLLKTPPIIADNLPTPIPPPPPTPIPDQNFTSTTPAVNTNGVKDTWIEVGRLDFTPTLPNGSMSLQVTFNPDPSNFDMGPPEDPYYEWSYMATVNGSSTGSHSWEYSSDPENIYYDPWPLDVGQTEIIAYVTLHDRNLPGPTPPEFWTTNCIINVDVSFPQPPPPPPPAGPQGSRYYFRQESELVPWARVSTSSVNTITIISGDSAGTPVPHAIAGLPDPVTGTVADYTDITSLTILFKKSDSMQLPKIR